MATPSGYYAEHHQEVIRLMRGVRHEAGLATCLQHDVVGHGHRVPRRKAYINAVRRSYRRDRWADQPDRVEVWSEKGTVRGTSIRGRSTTVSGGIRTRRRRRSKMRSLHSSSDAHGTMTTTTPRDVAPSSAALLLEEILETLRDLHAEQRRTNELLEKSSAKDLSASDPRADLLVAISAILGDDALPFSADDVLSASASSYELAEALAALRIKTVPALGYALRGVAERRIGNFTLHRSGRGWTIERH
jgi:hypothetical protein